MMLTEQEKEILDNAPEGATRWMIRIGGESKSEYGFGCLPIKDNEGYVFAYDAWDAISLADLRKKQEPIKPRMKVEYVRVVDSIFDLKDDLLAGNLYWKDSDGSFKVLIKRAVVSMKDDIKFAAAFMGDNLYRKVETEIKTEKQKIINELTDEFNNWISSDEDFAIHLTSKFNITKK
jgi:hypothetical protein